MELYRNMYEYDILGRIDPNGPDGWTEEERKLMTNNFYNWLTDQSDSIS